MTKYHSLSLAVFALAMGGAAALAPVPAAAATGEEACREAIATQSGGQIGSPDVAVSADGMVTVKTLVAGETYICTADASGKVLAVQKEGRGG